MTAPSPARNSPAAFSSSVTCCMFTSFPCQLLHCNPNGLQCQAGGTPTHRIHTILGTLFLPHFAHIFTEKRGKTVKNSVKQKSRSPLLAQGKTAVLQRCEMERMTGVEPAFKAWEAFVLPMNYIRSALYTSRQCITWRRCPRALRNEASTSNAGCRRRRCRNCASPATSA